MHLVDNADHDRVHRHVFGFRREPGTGALRNQHVVSRSGTQQVDGDERAAGRRQAAALARIDAIRFDDQQFVAHHRREFLRRNHRAGDLGNEHGLALVGSNCLAVIARACRATISSSLVGTVQIWTRLVAAWTNVSPRADALSVGSSTIPSSSRFAQTADRTRRCFRRCPR